MIRRVPAWLVWLVVVVQSVFVALDVLFEALVRAASSPLSPGFVVTQLANAAIILVYPAVGAIIYMHRPEHPIGWIFCLVNLGWAINNFAGVYAKYALLVNPGSLPGGEWAVWFYFWPGLPSTVLLVALVLLFPNGRLPSPRWRPLVWAVVGFEILATVGTAFAPGPVDSSIGFVVNNPLGAPGILGAAFSLIGGLGLGSTVLFVAVAAISMLLRFRGSSSLERQQLKWMTAALGFVSVITAIDMGLNFIYPLKSSMPAWVLVFDSLSPASTAFLPVAAGIAILRYRLYDIDVIINRTLVYGALTATLAAVYFGSVLLLEALVQPLTGQEHNDLVIVVSTLIIAALFMPLRRRIQAFIDRRFYRRKYDAARTLAEFGQVARDEVDLDVLTGKLVSVVNETIQPEHISLWLPDKL